MITVHLFYGQMIIIIEWFDIILFSSFSSSVWMRSEDKMVGSLVQWWPVWVVGNRSLSYSFYSSVSILIGHLFLYLESLWCYALNHFIFCFCEYNFRFGLMSISLFRFSFRLPLLHFMNILCHAMILIQMQAIRWKRRNSQQTDGIQSVISFEYWLDHHYLDKRRSKTTFFSLKNLPTNKRMNDWMNEWNFLCYIV